MGGVTVTDRMQDLHHAHSNSPTTLTPRRAGCHWLLRRRHWLFPSTAQGAVDSTGPSLTVPARSAYVIGQITDDPLFVDGELWFADRGAYRQFTWKASDPSGICRYTVDEFHNVEGWYDEAERYSTHATTGTYTYKNDDYENSDDMGQVRVNAYDCAGNVTSVTRPTNYIHIERDYGPTVPASGRALRAHARSATACCARLRRTHR